MNLMRRAAVISLRLMPILAIAILLSSPKEAMAQSLSVGNCAISTTSFQDTETICVNGTTGGDSGSDPALACVLPSTGGVAADDVTPDGCNELPAATTFSDEALWSPPTTPGSYVVVLFASDESVIFDNITITANSGNSAPTATAQSVSTAEDVALPITLSGTDPESDPLTFTVVGGPSNGTLSGAAPNLTYTPDLNFNGADSFTFTASDAEFTSAAATISITVNTGNDAPTATAQSVSTAEDVALPITLTGSDPESDPLTFLVVSGPSNGTLSGAAPNLTYTPDLNFNGADSFTFTASDAEFTSAAATISITVTTGNDEPAVDALIADQIAIEGAAFNLDVSANFRDADNDVLAFAASGLPASGNLNFDSQTGIFSGTPKLEDARDNDPYSIVVTASDSQPGSNPAQTGFELTISALDRANVSFDISVAPDPAMPNDELSWRLTASNDVGPQAATNIELTGSFVGEDLSISSTNSCSIQAAVEQVTGFECSLGDIAVGESSTVVFTTTTSSPGDVVVFASALSTDATPIDPNIADNSRQIVAGVAEAFSLGAVQVLGDEEVRALAAGDVDGDGDTDLIAGTTSGQPIQIYLSGGFRDFAEAAISLPDNSANEGMALADFDRNGTLDLVVANGDGQADRIYSNDGAGNFTLMATLGLSFSRDVAVGDFDSDGILDVVLATDQGNPVYLGDGLGGFALFATLGNADSHSVAVAKLNSDARDDIVFANTGSDSQIWIKNAGAGFSKGDRLAIGDAAAVAIGEFGGDRRPDLAFGRVSSGPGDLPANPVLINDGAGGFGVIYAAYGASPTNDIHAADVNRDGLTDLVFINSSSVHQIWTATGSGFDLHREQIVDVDSAVGVVSELGMADVGDPGGVDLAMGGAVLSGVGIFLNDGFGNLGFGDAVPPVLKLLGASAVSLRSGGAYSDAGATAHDNIDGDISGSIVATGAVNPAVVGEYTVTYNVVDRAGNDATPITRTVTVTAATTTGGGGSSSSGGGGGTLSLLVLFLLTISANRVFRSQPSVTAHGVDSR